MTDQILKLKIDTSQPENALRRLTALAQSSIRELESAAARMSKGGSLASEAQGIVTSASIGRRTGQQLKELTRGPEFGPDDRVAVNKLVSAVERAFDKASPRGSEDHRPIRAGVNENIRKNGPRIDAEIAKLSSEVAGASGAVKKVSAAAKKAAAASDRSAKAANDQADAQQKDAANTRSGTAAKKAAAKRQEDAARNQANAANADANETRRGTAGNKGASLNKAKADKDAARAAKERAEADEDAALAAKEKAKADKAAANRAAKLAAKADRDADKAAANARVMKKEPGGAAGGYFSRDDVIAELNEEERAQAAADARVKAARKAEKQRLKAEQLEAERARGGRDLVNRRDTTVPVRAEINEIAASALVQAGVIVGPDISKRGARKNYQERIDELDFVDPVDPANPDKERKRRSYRELQNTALELGLKANQKRDDLLAAIAVRESTTTDVYEALFFAQHGGAGVIPGFDQSSAQLAAAAARKTGRGPIPSSLMYEGEQLNVHSALQGTISVAPQRKGEEFRIYGLNERGGMGPLLAAGRTFISALKQLTDNIKRASEATEEGANIATHMGRSRPQQLDIVKQQLADLGGNRAASALAEQKYAAAVEKRRQQIDLLAKSQPSGRRAQLEESTPLPLTPQEIASREGFTYVSDAQARSRRRELNRAAERIRVSQEQVGVLPDYTTRAPGRLAPVPSTPQQLALLASRQRIAETKAFIGTDLGIIDPKVANALVAKFFGEGRALDAVGAQIKARRYSDIQTGSVAGREDTARAFRLSDEYGESSRRLFWAQRALRDGPGRDAESKILWNQRYSEYNKASNENIDIFNRLTAPASSKPIPGPGYVAPTPEELLAARRARLQAYEQTARTDPFVDKKVAAFTATEARSGLGVLSQLNSLSDDAVLKLGAAQNLKGTAPEVRALIREKILEKLAAVDAEIAKTLRDTNIRPGKLVRPAIRREGLGFGFETRLVPSPNDPSVGVIGPGSRRKVLFPEIVTPSTAAAVEKSLAQRERDIDERGQRRLDAQKVRDTDREYQRLLRRATSFAQTTGVPVDTQLEAAYTDLEGARFRFDRAGGPTGAAKVDADKLSAAEAKFSAFVDELNRTLDQVENATLSSGRTIAEDRASRARVASEVVGNRLALEGDPYEQARRIEEDVRSKIGFLSAARVSSENKGEDVVDLGGRKLNRNKLFQALRNANEYGGTLQEALDAAKITPKSSDEELGNFATKYLTRSRLIAQQSTQLNEELSGLSDKELLGRAKAAGLSPGNLGDSFTPDSPFKNRDAVIAQLLDKKRSEIAAEFDATGGQMRQRDIKLTHAAEKELAESLRRRAAAESAAASEAAETAKVTKGEPRRIREAREARAAAQAEAARRSSSSSVAGTGAGTGAVVTAEELNAINAAIVGQNAKATAAHAVAKALLLEVVSAQEAVAAQGLKSAAALEAAVALEAVANAAGAEANALKGSANRVRAQNVRSGVPLKQTAEEAGGELSKRVTFDNLSNAQRDLEQATSADALVARKLAAQQAARLRLVDRTIQLQAEIEARASEEAKAKSRRIRSEARSRADSLGEEYLISAAAARLKDDAGDPLIASLKAKIAVLTAEEEAYVAKNTAVVRAKLKVTSELVELEAQNLVWARLSAKEQQDYVRAQAEARVIAEERGAAERKLLASGPLGGRYRAAKVESAVSDARVRSDVDSAINAQKLADLQDQSYVDALKLDQINKAKIAIIEGQVATEAKIFAAQSQTAVQTELAARLQVEQNVIKARERVALLAAEKENSELVKLKAQEAVLQKELNAKLRAEFRKQVRGANIPLFDRLGLSGGHGGSGGSPFSLGGGIGSALGSVVRYGAGSAIAYGALAGLKESLQVAQELEVEFAKLRSQSNELFKGTGKDAQEEFNKLSESILRIARETGTASTEVSKIALQFQGAFGGNTNKTIRETAAAIETVKLTGLSLNESIDAFTALTQSFKDQGVTIDEVSDKAFGLEARFGVLAKETISFAADLAPVASAAGFTVEELESLGAVAQKYSGRSGSQLAEAFGRIIPQISTKAVEFSTFLRTVGEQNSALGDKSKLAIQALGAGDTQKFLEELIGLYPQLTKSQRDWIVETLGGRREAQSLIGVLENGKEVLKEWGDEVDDSGKRAERFSQFQQTLSQRIARLGEQLKQIAVDLFNNGLGDVLKGLLDVSGLLVSGLGAVLGPVTKVFTVFDGAPAKILGAVLALKGLVAVMKLAGAAFAGSSLGNLGASIGAALSTRSAGSAGLAGLSSANSAASVAGLYTPTVGQAAKNLGGNIATGLKAAGPQVAIAAAAIGVQFALEARQAAIEETKANFRKQYEADLSRAKASGNITGSTVGQSLANIGADALGARLPREQEFQTASNFVEGLTDLPDLFLGYATFQRDQYTDLDQTDEEIARMRQARKSFIEAYGSRFQDSINQVIESGNDSLLLLGDAIFEEGRKDLGIRDGFAVKQGTFLTAGGSKDPAKVLEELKKKGQFDPKKFDVGFDSKILGRTVVTDEEEIQSTLLKIRENQFEALTDAEFQSFVAIAEKFDIGIPPALRARLDAVAAKTPEAIQAKLDTAALSLGELNNSFSAGDISFAEYIRQLKLLESDAAALGDNKQAKQLGAQTRKTIREAVSQNIRSETEFVISLGARSGAPDLDANVSRLLGDLRGGQLTDKDRAATAESIVATLKQIQERKLATAESAEQELAIMREGVEVPLDVRVEDVNTQLDQFDQAWQQFIEQVKTDLPELANQVRNAVSARILETGESVSEATRNVLLVMRALVEDQLKAMEGLDLDGSATAALQQKLDEINQLLASQSNGALKDSSVAASPARLGPDPQAIAKKERDLQIAYQRAQFELRKSQVGNDAVATARIDLNAAQYELVLARQTGDIVGQTKALSSINEANRRIQSGLSRREQARLTYLKSLAGGDTNAQNYYDELIALSQLADARTNNDPEAEFAALARLEELRRKKLTDPLELRKGQLDVARAQAGSNQLILASIEQQQADIDLQIAQINNDQLGIARATAARISADRAARDAMLSLQEAQLSIVQAQAQAVDDTVAAAEVGIQQARLAIERAKNNNDPAALLQAEAQLISAQDAVHDARLQTAIESQQFLYDMGQITRQQFISYLTSLLSMAGNSEKDIQNIRRQIKQLQGEANQNLQFNLPSNIGLGLLYESRRLNQSVGANGAGVGYQDNRNVNIVVNVNSGMDVAQVKTVLSDALGGGRFGSTPRRY